MARCRQQIGFRGRLSEAVTGRQATGDALLFPTHAVVPSSAVGLQFDGQQLPFVKVDIAESIGHVPIVLRSQTADRSVQLSTDTPAANPSFDVTFSTYTATHGPTGKAVGFGAFLNGSTLSPATNVSDEDTALSKCRKTDGTYTNGRWRQYYKTVAGSNAVRIQHNMRIPTTTPPSAVAGNFTDNLGFEMTGFGTAIQSSLGNATSGYNVDSNAQWTGWVAGNGVFVSVRGVANQWPRGFSLSGGTLRLYIHFENGDRVRAGDYDYSTIADLKYLHQGKLNLYLPDEYVTACGSGQIKEEVVDADGITIAAQRSYPCGHAGQTLEILVAFYDPANGTPDFAAWHALHEASPVVSLITVNGMKGADFADVEAVIKADILSYANEHGGQFIDGNIRQSETSLTRCFAPNHYRWCSYTYREFVRTRDQDILRKARQFHRFYRDLAVYDVAATVTNLGFSHGKSLLPWNEITAQGHWIDPDSLKYAWLYDADRVSRDKYALWNPDTGDWTVAANREVKNVIVMARHKKDFLNEAYTELAAMKTSLESKTIATYLSEGSAGIFWHPQWMDGTYAALQTGLRRKYEGIWTLFPATQNGEKANHYGWLGRIASDRGNIRKRPGPLGDGFLHEQWGYYLEVLRNAGVTGFNYLDEMGTYPIKPTVYDGATVGLDITFTKTADPLTVTIGMMSPDGDIQATKIQYQKPDASIVVLQSRFPTWNGTGWDEDFYERESGRQGLSKEFDITGPAGVYHLQFMSNQAGIFGPITGLAEYSTVQVNAECGLIEGWFKPTGSSTAVYILNDNTDYVTPHSTLEDWFVWNTAGTFAAQQEWLP